MKIFVIFSVAILSILILNVNASFSESTEPSKIKLHKMRTSFVDGTQPLVFVGKLTSDSGKPIHNATIVIKNDQGCPLDQIIGQGVTKKSGKFSIHVIPEVWNEKDNRVTFHAEFIGNEKYSSSISEKRMFIIWPYFSQTCEN